MFAFRKEIIEVLVYVASDVGEDRNPTKVEQFVLAIVNIVRLHVLIAKLNVL